MSPIHRFVLPIALALPFAAPAQEAPQTAPIVAPETLPTPVPSPVPTSMPAPVATPTPAPPVVVSPVPAPVPIVRPSPAATPTPRATPTPAPDAASAPVTETPSPAAAPTAIATPAAAPRTADPGPDALASPVPTIGEGEADRSLWPWALAAALLLLGAIGLWLARREPPGAGEPASAPAAPVETPAAPVAPTPHLTLAFRPTRAGFNMLSATVEGELELTNAGDAAADGVRVRTTLLSAHVGQATEFAAFVAEPIGRPAVPVFTLAPGERRVVRLVAAAPREGLRTMTAGGRPMFVPVFAINIRTADGEQAAQAFAIGIERVDSAKLAPFWLDVPPRSYDQVAARPHGAPIVAVQSRSLADK